jgi:hypothetical protein
MVHGIHRRKTEAQAIKPEYNLFLYSFAFGVFFFSLLLILGSAG